MKKIITYILIISLLSLFYLGYKLDNKKDENIINDSIKINDKLSELRKEKKELEVELIKINEEISIKNMGSTILLISDTNSLCLDNALSLLDQYDFHSVLAIDINYLPDNNISGYLNRSDIDNLLYKGYELVLRVDNNTDIINSYNTLMSLNYDIKGLYIDTNDITNNMIKDIKSLDINTVITNIDLIDEDLFIIRNYGNKQANVKKEFTNSVEASKIISMSVGYNKDIDKYEYSNYQAMLNTINTYVSQDATKVTNITETIDRYNKYIEKTNMEINEERIDYINNRLIEIEKEIVNLSK